MYPAPFIQSLYRGFVLTLPRDAFGNIIFNLNNIQRVDWQYATSQDDSIYTQFQDLAETFTATNFAFIHDGLFTNLYYQYRFRLWTYSSNNTLVVSDWSDIATAGNGVVQSWIDSGVTSLDQIASSLGVMQSGILRGLIFETSSNYPKVRMDPTGFYAIGGYGATPATPIYIPSNPSPTNPIIFSGALQDCNLTSYLPSDIITGSFMAGSNALRWVDPTSQTVVAQVIGREQASPIFQGQIVTQVAGGSYLAPPSTSTFNNFQAYTGGQNFPPGSYTFYVSAVNAVGETNLSPGTSTNLTGNLTGVAASVSWTTSSGATGYKLYMRYQALGQQPVGYYMGYVAGGNTNNGLYVMNNRIPNNGPNANTASAPSSRIIHGGAGKSDFLQTFGGSMAGQGWVATSEIITLTWPGGANGSNGYTWAHGVTGAFNALYFAESAGSDTLFFVGATSPTISNVVLQGWAPAGLPPAGHQQSAYVFALVQIS